MPQKLSRPTPTRRNRSKMRAQMPLCRSLFLQDLSIALGRYMKRLKRGKRRFIVERSVDNTDGTDRERLDLELRSLLGFLAKCTIWEDGVAWVYVRRDSPKRDRHVVYREYLDLRALTLKEAGDILFDVLENHIVPKNLLLKEHDRGE